MNILVLISVVPNTTSKISFKDNDTLFDSEGINYIINPYEEFGLSWAVKYKEKNPETTITVITVGEVFTENVLRKCLAIGADKAVRINVQAKDGFSVANEIAAYDGINTYDIIIGGRESIDYNGGMVTGILAASLSYNYINPCTSLEINEKRAIATRDTDYHKESIECELPLVIATQKGIVEESELIIPNMRAIMGSKQKPLEVVESKFDKANVTIEKYEKPSLNTQTKFIDADNIDELVEALHKKEKLI